MRRWQSLLLSRRVSGGQAAPESCTTRGPPHRARGGSTKAAARSRAGGQTDPALIDWQRFGRFRLPQENRSYKFAHLQCIGESASLRKERPRGAKPRHQIRNQCSRPHTKMRNLMMNIPWVYRILSESRPPSGKRGRGAQNLVIKYGSSARDRTRRCGT